MMNFRSIIQSRLFNNFYNLFFLYGFSHIIPLLLIPFLLNTLGVVKYGVVNFALAFSFYFQVINEFGFDLSNVRHIVSNRENPQEISKILTAILGSKLFILACSLLVYLPIIFFIDLFKGYFHLYILAFIRLIGIVIAPYWLFRSMEDVKYVTRITIPLKTICILPIFFIVKSPDSYLWVMFFYALQEIISGIVALYVAKRKYQLTFQKITISDIRFFILDSIPFFTSTFLMRIYKNSNAVILGIFSGDYIVGIYSAAEKLHNAYSAFVSPLLSQVFYPYFTRVKDYILINRITISIIVGNGLLLLLLYIVSPYLIPLFIKTDISIILSYFNWFLLLLFISVPNDILGFPYLGVMGFVNKVNITTIQTTIVYVLGVAVLIICNSVTILPLILLLIFSTSVCLIMRMFFIHKYKAVKL